MTKIERRTAEKHRQARWSHFNVKVPFAKPHVVGIKSFKGWFTITWSSLNYKLHQNVNFKLELKSKSGCVSLFIPNWELVPQPPILLLEILATASNLGVWEEIGIIVALINLPIAVCGVNPRKEQVLSWVCMTAHMINCCYFQLNCGSNNSIIHHIFLLIWELTLAEVIINSSYLLCTN